LRQKFSEYVIPLFPKNEHLHSRRRGRRWQRRDADKELLRLDRELDRLYGVKRSAPLIRLEKPYQRGWVRDFQLTERARKRADRDELLALLKVVDKRQFCRRGSFESAVRRRGKRVPLNHNLHRPSFAELLHPRVAEDLLLYFRLPGGPAVLSRANLRTWMNLRRNSRSDVICPQHFESTVRPLIVTHRRTNLPEVEARIDEIHSIFESGAGWGRLRHLHGYCDYWFRDEKLTRRRRALDAIASAEMRDARLAFNEAPPPELIDLIPNQAEEGTTKIVPFDFPGLSFPAAA
jgi:hypothetical protein